MRSKTVQVSLLEPSTKAEYCKRFYELITIVFSTSPVTSIDLNPSEITKVDVISCGNGVALLLEIGKDKQLIFMESLLRMEVRQGGKSQ